jgi:hypothetical protein
MTSARTSLYAEHSTPALPAGGLQLDLAHTTLVVTDPQIDFLSPEGVTWEIFGAGILASATWSTAEAVTALRGSR